MGDNTGTGTLLTLKITRLGSAACIVEDCMAVWRVVLELAVSSTGTGTLGLHGLHRLHLGAHLIWVLGHLVLVLVVYCSQGCVQLGPGSVLHSFVSPLSLYCFLQLFPLYL